MTTRFNEANGRTGNERPTDKFDGHPDFNSLSLNKGDLVDDRFIIQETILTESGEADIFRCKDYRTGEDAVLKFYRIKYQPKEQVITEFLNLDHPDLVRVIKYGTWSGRFYEVMEYCSGGMLSNCVPLDVAAIRLLLPGIVNGLNYLHSKNIIHRDIKPDNFYFRHPHMQELVIGDFGISSLLEHDQHTHKTESQAWTVDYAAPEIFGNKIYTESDYYSLGITLIHLFFGVSPFKEGFVARDAIVAAHMKGDIPNVEKLPDDLQYIVTGLTQLKPSNRWGYGQVMQWLKGAKVLTDAGLPWQKDRYAGKEFPYPSYPTAKTPAELAAALDKFDAQNDLYRGRISAWVFQNFHDADMTKKIEYIEENSGKKRALGVIKLGFVLDPTLPLKISGTEVTCLEDLITLLKMKGANMGHDLKQALFDEYLECWIDNTQDIAGGDKSRLLQDIASIRNRFKDAQEVGLFALLYTLSPSTPLVIDADRNIIMRRPEDLEKILSKDPSLIEKVSLLFFDRYLEEWLRIAFAEDGERKACADLLSKARTLYARDKDLASWVIRWIVTPTLGFPFGKEMVANPKELAKIIDKSAETKNTGITLLHNGWIKAWLVHTKQITENDASAFDNIIKEGKSNWDKILEGVLGILDPSRPGPKVSVDKKSIDFGKVLIDTKKTETLTIKNAGKGYLSGIITLDGGQSGITVDNIIFDNNEVTVTITVNTLGLEEGRDYKSKLILNTNGGNLEIPVSFSVISSSSTKLNPFFYIVIISLCMLLFIAIFSQKNTNTVLNTPAAAPAASAVPLSEGEQISLANFVLIRGGEFTMGSPETEVGRSPDEAQHQVRVSDFYMDKYEVTVAEFRRFVEATGYQWSNGSQGQANHPVVHVSWNDAVAYCKWLSQTTGKQFRLPTEAEWEYACRAGSTTPFNTGENLTTNQANYDGNYPYDNKQKGVFRQNTVAVNSFVPNAFGLYNMHGNVWEWTDSWYDSSRSRRVIRGGSWNHPAENCRSALRLIGTPVFRNDIVGFRLVFVP